MKARHLQTKAKQHLGVLGALGALGGAIAETSEQKMNLVAVVDQHRMKITTHPSIPSLSKEVTSAY